MGKKRILKPSLGLTRVGEKKNSTAINTGIAETSIVMIVMPRMRLQRNIELEIYRCKFQEVVPCFQTYKNMLKVKVYTKHKVAESRGKLGK